MQTTRPTTLWRPYCQMQTAADPIEVVGTAGVRLHLADGRELVDGIASWWTACHGYNHPAIVDAICQQAKTMPHVMLGGIVHQPAIELTDRLSKLAGVDNSRVFLSDSGSVAVEVALKMCVQFWRNQGDRQRSQFICFKNSYHGDTTGAMSVCDPEDSMHSHFKGFLLQQFPFAVPSTDEEFAAFDSFLKTHRQQTAGVIIEPLIQMAAGMKFHSPDALKRIAKIVQQHDLILIADEVATGLGRTGSMLAVNQAEVVPDILCVGKALTGGCVGLAATIASQRVYEKFDSERSTDALMHGPTFMGNPIACAAANASLRLFDTEPRLQQVSGIESQLSDALSGLRNKNGIIDVRVKGAVGVVQFDHEVDVDAAIAFFVQRGVWIRPLRDTVYLAPSFTIQPGDLEVLCDAVAQYVDQFGQVDSEFYNPNA